MCDGSPPSIGREPCLERISRSSGVNGLDESVGSARVHAPDSEVEPSAVRRERRPFYIDPGLVGGGTTENPVRAASGFQSARNADLTACACLLRALAAGG